MPYLQVELDAMDSFSAVALKTGLSEGDVCVGMLKLWRHCWKAKATHVTRDRLETLFACDTDKLIQALETCEFIDRPTTRPDFHVRGSEKRLGIQKARSDAGKTRGKGERDAKGRLKKAKRPALAGGLLESPPAPVQHPSSTEPGLTSSIQHPASSIKNIAGEGPPEETPGWKGLVDGLFSRFKAKRGTDPTPTGKDWKRLKALRERTKANDPEILLRWERGLVSAYKQRVDSFFDLDERWDALAGTASSTGPPVDIRKSPVRAEDVPSESFKIVGVDNAF